MDASLNIPAGSKDINQELEKKLNFPRVLDSRRHVVEQSGLFNYRLSRDKRVKKYL